MKLFAKQSQCYLTNYLHGKRSVNVLTMGVFITMLFSIVCTVNAQRDYSGPIHDPTNIVKEGDTYYTFYTSNGVECAYSTDLCTWRNGGRIFPQGWPNWINDYVDGFGGHFWAPEVFYLNGKWHVYYSTSTFGERKSAIGLVTSLTLQNPQWQDQGMVVYTNNSSNHNAIDADVFRAEDGRVFLIYGSFWAGIVMTELDTITGKPFDRNDLRFVAGGDPEAAAAMKHGDYYYLFFNRGKCCDGLNSTYYILVGRSTSPTGPFLDKNGVNTSERNGGTIVLDDEGRFIGPGHFGHFAEGGREYMSYHYYDGNQNGFPKLKIATISWEDGWPVINTGFDACNPPVIEDCAGVDGGTAYIDQCGECVEGTTGLDPCERDCNGDWGGAAYRDDCGACVGGQTGAQPCFGSVQGENAGEFDGVIESDNEGFVADGYLNFTNENGSAASWNLEAQEAVGAPIMIVYANGSTTNRAVALSINGTIQHESIDMQSTGEWTTWQSVTVDVNFQQGANELTLTSLTDEGGPNIDMLTYASDLLSEATVSAGLDTKIETRMSSLHYARNTVCFDLKETSDISLVLYSIAGREVRTLFKGKGLAGRNTFQILKDQLASSVYILRMTGKNGLNRSLTITIE